MGTAPPGHDLMGSVHFAGPVGAATAGAGAGAGVSGAGVATTAGATTAGAGAAGATGVATTAGVEAAGEVVAGAEVVAGSSVEEAEFLGAGGASLSPQAETRSTNAKMAINRIGVFIKSPTLVIGSFGPIVYLDRNLEKINNYNII